MVESVSFEGAKEELERATRMAQGDLLERACAMWALRTLIGGLPNASSNKTTLQQARETKLRLIAREEEEFAPLREQVRKGELDANWWREQIVGLVPYGRDVFTERLFGLYDAPAPELGREEEMVHLVPSPVDQILEVASFVQPNDVFCDLGCGMGHVSLIVRWVTGVKCFGMEFEPAYTQMAEAANAALGLGVEFMTLDARAFDYSQANFFFMYEPFRGDLMLGVLGKIRARSREAPVAIAARFATGNPLVEQDWLQQVEETPGGVKLYRPRP